MQEDDKMIVYVTEPIECNLAALATDPSKKDLIPGDLEIKLIILELLEVLNFLHQTAKTIHMNLTPEHIYLTKEGKIKLAGFNFFQSFSTAESINIGLKYDLIV